ncbi:hypothetical protein D9M72_599940 [compost metagenome]
MHGADDENAWRRQVDIEEERALLRLHDPGLAGLQGARDRAAPDIRTIIALEIDLAAAAG